MYGFGEVCVGYKMEDVHGRLTFGVGVFVTVVVSGDKIYQVVNNKTKVCVETLTGEEPVVTGRD